MPSYRVGYKIPICLRLTLCLAGTNHIAIAPARPLFTMTCTLGGSFFSDANPRDSGPQGPADPLRLPIGQIWPIGLQNRNYTSIYGQMILTVNEQRDALGQRIKTRRIALNFTQQIAAERAGVAYRTWRRMESDGSASIDDLIRAAYALRCEDGIEALFPEPVARSMEELLQMQRQAAKRKVRQRAGKAK